MGKGGDPRKGDASEQSAGNNEKIEVLIGDRYYDVTTMIKTNKHPGGSVIKFYAGKGVDATQAFENFHVRSAKAEKMMKSLDSRPANPKELQSKQFPKQKELLADFQDLTRQLKAEGFFKPNLFHVFYRVMEIVVMHAVGFYLLFNGTTTFYILSGLAILGVVSGRCGWLMHEGGHYSLTGKIAIDRSLQIVLYGLGCGMSGSWWRIQHNKHHSMPQKLGHDVDLDTLPLVAFTNKVVKRVGISMKTWLKLQGYLFPVLTTMLVALGWQFYLHPRHVLRTKNWAEAISMGSRYILWHMFFTPRFGGLQAFAMYLAYTWIGANYIFINFAVSHTHLPTVPKEDTEVDWVRYAAVHTMNVAPGPFKWVDWWMSYLNYQIEHHLFPSMPQYRHPIISPRVKALFEKHGLGKLLYYILYYSVTELMCIILYSVSYCITVYNIVLYCIIYYSVLQLCCIMLYCIL